MKSGHRHLLMMAVMLSAGLCSCGAAKRGSETTTRASGSPAGYTATTGGESQGNAYKPEPVQHVDGDIEGAYTVKPLPGGHYDQDEVPSLHFGYPATRADRLAVTNIVGRYNAAVATDDGTKACTLLYSELAEGIVGDFHHPLGSQKKDCPTVVTWLFKFAHRRKVVAPERTLHVMRVLVRRGKALVLMGAGSTVEHTLMVRRELGGWRIGEMYVEPLS